MPFISLWSSACTKFSWKKHSLALLFQLLCKYCLWSSLVQKNKIKNKILQFFPQLPPAQPSVLISFLNFCVVICIPFKPHIIFHLLKKKKKSQKKKSHLVVSWPGHTSEHWCSPCPHLYGCLTCSSSTSGGIIIYNIPSSYSPINAETLWLYTTINLLWCSDTEQTHVWFSLLGSCSLEAVK